MTFFKTIALAACLATPLLSEAAITSFADVDASTGNGANINGGGGAHLATGSFTDTGFTLVQLGKEVGFSDSWSLNLPAGQIATIYFHDVSPGANAIGSFAVTETTSN